MFSKVRAPKHSVSKHLTAAPFNNDGRSFTSNRDYAHEDRASHLSAVIMALRKANFPFNSFAVAFANDGQHPTVLSFPQQQQQPK